MATTLYTQAQTAPAEHAPRAPLDARGAGWQRLLGLWHLSSLDAPTVAVVWTMSFARAAAIRLPLWVPVVLALCAWSVYIGDRLLDAYKAMGTPQLSNAPCGTSDLRPRHYFHWKHRRILLPLSIVSALTAISLVVYYMPLAARERNAFLVLAGLVYFTSVHSPWKISAGRFRMPKELLVGILFTCACALPVCARMPADLSVRLRLLPSILAFIALAWLNCAAIEVWESTTSQRRHFSVFSFAIALSLSAICAACLTAAFREVFYTGLLGTVAVAAMLTAVLDRNSSRLPPTVLRAAADVVLLTPALLLVFIARP